MEKLIILGLIGYVIYLNLPEPTTEPPTVTDRENLPPAIVSPQIAPTITGNNSFARENFARWLPMNLDSYNRYETSFRLTD